MSWKNDPYSRIPSIKVAIAWLWLTVRNSHETAVEVVFNDVGQHHTRTF